jgi:Flp pilus assembly protein TadB
LNLGHRVEECFVTCDDRGVPLSEEEQRILRQIEEQLEQDPTFAQRGYRISRRRSVFLVVGLVVGLTATVVCLAVSYVAAFVVFLFVLYLAVKLEAEMRVLGREQLGQLPISSWLHARRPDEQSDVSD